MTRKLGLLVLTAALCACSGELADGPTPDNGTPDGGTPDGGTPDAGLGASCTDGVDCHCDRFADPTDSLYESTVLFCEDFEDPVLNNGDQAVRGVDGSGDGWADKYGPANNNCLDMAYPSGTGQRDEGQEGTWPWSCINVVQEGACEVEGDCVFQGTSSLAHRMVPDRTGGGVGSANFSSSNVRNFGVTLAMKVTRNYVSPKDPGNNGPAHKTNEFGEWNQCIMGCSTFNAGNPSWPFGAGLKTFSANPGGVMVRGVGEWDGSSGYRFGPTHSDYDFQRDWGKGAWACFQMQWTGWGTSNAEARYWINGREIIHLRNLNMTSLSGNSGGIRSFIFNNYYNGADGTQSGYTGSTMAHRLEDNLVITSGEPVSCEAIGFGDATLASSR